MTINLSTQLFEPRPSPANSELSLKLADFQYIRWYTSLSNTNPSFSTGYYSVLGPLKSKNLSNYNVTKGKKSLLGSEIIHVSEYTYAELCSTEARPVREIRRSRDDVSLSTSFLILNERPMAVQHFNPPL